MSSSTLFPVAELGQGQMGARRFSWSYAKRHFDDLGAVRGGAYSFLRDLIPPALVAGWWFTQHRARVTGLWNFLWNQRVSVLDLCLLAAMVLCWRLIAGGSLAGGRNLVKKQVVGIVAAAACSTLLVTGEAMAHVSRPRAMVLGVGFFAVSLMLDLGLLATACVARWARLTYLVPKCEVVLVGTGGQGQKLFAELMESPIHRVVGVVDDEFFGTEEMRPLYRGGVSALEEILAKHPVQIVYCSLPVKSQYQTTQEVITVCERIGVEVRQFAQVFQTKIGRLDSDRSGMGAFAVLRMVKAESTRGVKRAMDVAGALALLVATLPLIVVAALAVKLTSKGPAFFSQERYGFNRRRFRMYKLRSMVTDAEALQAQLEDKNELGGPVFKIKKDPRITKVGAFLRKTSIDELPQLWNVLIGDMSLVGPRPLAVRDVLKIEDASHLRRFSMRPGITCIWQMTGRNSSDFETWIRQDLEYIDNWSLGLDWEILFGTVPAVLLRRGAM